jgi:hypothetical protein
MLSRNHPTRLYGIYSAAFLLLTLITGVWLRAVFVEPEVLGGFRFAYALHAHSHVAFFGWTTMALFAVLVGRLPQDHSSRGLQLHAHAVGIASAAAFVGFLLSGYAAHTIALSVLHVALWVAFIFAVWPRTAKLGSVERRYWRGALVFLLLAGAGAMTPGIVMVRQIGDPWLNQLAVKSFLTPFLSGWLLLGVMGAVYAAVERRRLAGAAFWLIVLGALPSTLFHTTTPPPAEWLTLSGRAGTALVGAGTLLFAVDVLRSTAAAPLLRLVGIVAAAKGGAEVLVSGGVLIELTSSRQMTIAYLHLVLLGLVTPALLAAALGVRAAPRRTAAYAAGLALMVGSLVGIGWPALGVLLHSIGLDAGLLFKLALLGGATSTVAGAALLIRVPSRTLERVTLPGPDDRARRGGPELVPGVANILT